MADLPEFPRQIVASVMTKPQLGCLFVSFHEQNAIFLCPIKDKVDMIVHQTKTNDHDRVILAEPTETKSNAVHARNERLNRSEEDIIWFS